VWPFDRKKEERNALSNPNIPITSDVLIQLIGGDNNRSVTPVNEATMLGVPAIWCAINFWSGTVSSLPLQVFKNADNKREIAKSNRAYPILHDQVNDEGLTSVQWRRSMMQSAMVHGRHYTYIERDRSGRMVNLWPLEYALVRVTRKNGRKIYTYSETGKQDIVYSANEILDIPFMLLSDGISHASPMHLLKDSIGLALSLGRYAGAYFHNSGVPPLAVVGPPASEAAVSRTKADISANLRRDNAPGSNANVMYLPTGFDIKPVSFKPQEGQLTEARLFQIQEISRIYGLPPSFLHDLSNGTFTNTEQQDLHFLKHSLTHWLRLIEQELNSKIFGRRSDLMAEFNVDGVLRGDFKTRMEGYALGIQHAIITPDEARSSENRPQLGGEAEKLHIQGATVPLGSQSMKESPNVA
jgi:HK97 family phage portal protein